MHVPAQHPLQSTFVSEDADPKTSSLWVRRGERLGDALIALRTRVSSFLSLFRKSAAGEPRMTAR